MHTFRLNFTIASPLMLAFSFKILRLARVHTVLLAHGMLCNPLIPGGNTNVADT